MASSNHLTKALRPGAITVGDGALPYEFGGETRSAHKSVCNRSDRIDCLPNSPCSRLLAAEMPVPIFPASFVSGDHMTSFWPIRCKQPPPPRGLLGVTSPRGRDFLEGEGVRSCLSSGSCCMGLLRQDATARAEVPDNTTEL